MPDTIKCDYCGCHASSHDSSGCLFFACRMNCVHYVGRIGSTVNPFEDLNFRKEIA